MPSMNPDGFEVKTILGSRVFSEKMLGLLPLLVHCFPIDTGTKQPTLFEERDRKEGQQGAVEGQGRVRAQGRYEGRKGRGRTVEMETKKTEDREKGLS